MIRSSNGHKSPRAQEASTSGPTVSSAPGVQRSRGRAGHKQSSRGPSPSSSLGFPLALLNSAAFDSRLRVLMLGALLGAIGVMLPSILQGRVLMPAAGASQ